MIVKYIAGFFMAIGIFSAAENLKEVLTLGKSLDVGAFWVSLMFIAIAGVVYYKTKE
jgi:hypothetical protein